MNGTVPLLGEEFRAALTYAAEIHAHQRRKGSGVPYVAHLMSVAALVLEDGGSQTEAVAALLHDAVEDQGGRERRREILSLFGPEVTRIVDGCTDSWESPKPPWRRRKEAHIAALRDAERDVLRVTSADKLHNARSILADLRRIGEETWTRFQGGRDGTLWYYRSMLDLLAGSAPGAMIDELGRVFAEMERLAGSHGAAP